MKNKIIFLPVVLLVFSASVFAQEQSSSEYVESFYKFHRARERTFNAGEVNLHKKWFTAELNRLFQNELKREKEYLKKNPGNKPFFGDGFSLMPLEECTSGGKLSKNVLKVGSETIRKSVAIVEVKFSEPKPCGGALIETYKVELVKSDGVWLINDWIYGDGERLSGDLKRTKY